MDSGDPLTDWISDRIREARVPERPADKKRGRRDESWRSGVERRPIVV
jgi:hypothetical protein